jgi:Cytochrome c554 and c-prime
MKGAGFIVAELLASVVAAADGSYAGNQACAACHRDESSHHRGTAMAHALEPVATCEILKQRPKLKFQEAGYSSEIARQGDRSVLTVTGGGGTLTVPLLWAFGLGRAGQTYVFEREGAFYESRVSFFESIRGLDLTMGAQNSQPKSLEDAAGRRIDPSGARDCFGCHSTGAVKEAALHVEELTPGVGCEACHGPAAKHAIAMRSGRAVEAPMARLANLTTEEISDLCGACHRTWSQIAMNGPRGVNNVRFQPYRLTNSKCYDAADPRIRCTACHDPHQAPTQEASFYDSKCAACHSAAAVCFRLFTRTR